MAIQSSLLKPIHIAYALGSVDGKVLYEEPIKVYAQIEDVKSLYLKEDVGFLPDFDRAVLVPYGERTQFIDEQTLLWINAIPNESKSNSDYKIERIGDIIDGNFILYCNSLTPKTTPIYYERGGIIYQTKMELNGLVGDIPLNKYLPVGYSTKFWLTKPKSVETTTNLIRLISKERLESSYRLTFERVEE